MCVCVCLSVHVCVRAYCSSMGAPFLTVGQVKVVTTGCKGISISQPKIYPVNWQSSPSCKDPVCSTVSVYLPGM